MLYKCLKCRESGHQLSDCHIKNLNLVEAKVDGIEVNVAKDRDDKWALELEVDEGYMVNCNV